MKILALFLLLSTGLYSQNFSVTAHAGPAFPTGEFSELWNTGFEANIVFAYKLQSNIDVAVTTGYAKWGFNNDAFNKSFNSNITFDLDVPFTSIPLLIGARYYLGRDDLRPYTFITAGFYFLEYTTSGSYTINNTTFNIPAIKEKETETGLSAGAGVHYKISKNMNIDIAAKFNLINDTEAIKQAQQQGVAPGNAGATTTTYFSVSAGINILF